MSITHSQKRTEEILANFGICLTSDKQNALSGATLRAQSPDNSFRRGGRPKPSNKRLLYEVLNFIKVVASENRVYNNTIVRATERLKAAPIALLLQR